ncbi:MAG TPA: Uma2 family endonuclease [Longimicrobiales bacterium]|nr:Uma2 family endonuclease [Longimicrobiales bacterium]
MEITAHAAYFHCMGQQQASDPAEALFTAEQYASLPDDDAPTELVRGRIVREAQPKWPHARVQLWLGYLLTSQIEAHGWPLECAGPVGCVVEEHPDTVRGPDLVVVRSGRPPGRAEFIGGGPELAIEILSPSNRRGEVRRKIEEYLAAGTSIVWVVDPRRRAVAVHSRNAAMRELRADAPLDGGDLMPDLPITVAQIFSVLP